MVRLINLSSEELVVLVDSIESGFQLSDVLIFDIVVNGFNLAHIQRDLGLVLACSSYRSDVKPISLSVLFCGSHF